MAEPVKTIEVGRRLVALYDDGSVYVIASDGERFLVASSSIGCELLGASLMELARSCRELRRQRWLKADGYKG